MSITKIQEGINYLRMMNRGMNVPELAEELNVSEESIKEAIRVARQHKDAAEKPPKVAFKEPRVKVFQDLVTGERQAIESIEVELLRDIIVKFAHEEVSEFTTMLPVTIKIKRKWS